MVGQRPKVHLRIGRKFDGAVRTACGLIGPPRSTNRSGRVTCGACQRTLAMADSELRRQSRKS